MNAERRGISCQRVCCPAEGAAVELRDADVDRLGPDDIEDVKAERS